MRVKDAVGRFGERVACEHLTAAGMQIIERNWRCPAGEIDVIAFDGDELVVVEVKTRSTERFGSPMLAVDRAKMARLRRLAVVWMSSHSGGARPRWASVRFDVVAVVRAADGNELGVTHVRGAF